MVIRRASDSTTTTIGFDGSGNIDEAAINTFCSGTSCTVYQWRDQSGNGNDATAAAPANEPTIYTGGALVKENGTVAVEFSNDTLTLDSSITTNALCVFSMHVDGDNQYFPLRQGTTNYVWFHTNFNQLRAFMGGIYAIDSYSSKGTMGLRTFIKKGTSGNGPLNYVDGFNITTAGYETLDTETGTFTTLGAYTGKSQEVIVYTSDKSSVRTSIEENIADYFTQNTPLLDTYSGAAAAYSLRLLSSSHSGALVEVYNGSSYADIGANVFGELDTVALASHCGSNNGFVSKWYDQSGNSNTAAQATTANMPKIYDGTTGVVTENGKVALQLDGSNDYLNASTSDLFGTNFALYFVHRVTGGSARKFLIESTTASGAVYNPSLEYGESTLPSTISTYSGANATAATIQSSIQFNSSQRIITVNKNGTTSFELFADGSSLGTATPPNVTGMNGFNLGTYRGANDRYFGGTFQEVILYNSDQSSNRTNIEDNINTFYSIY